MNNGVMNWWNNRSDEYYGGLRGQLGMLIDNPAWAFPRPVFEMIKKAFPDLRGKRVLVPSSGDNMAVFGFNLLGAIVTSCDIAERQLYNAKMVADENGWEIEFIQQNSMELDRIGDGEYDLVYTSNGVHVWISDLPKMYSNFNRVLKPNGKYIMFETHPFIRPFDDSGKEVIIDKPYEETGPFISGEITDFAWRIQDIFNAVFDSGFSIKHMEEFHPEKNDYDDWFYGSIEAAAADNYDLYNWTKNPWAALPQWIGFLAEK